ncbi:involucrin [Drosophila mojavensis]|uniref:involucrin n=1 Tax=Drosophila mojavensis TaxID=7230 RepID=UPI001CD056CF|nr:involucrin [Drosophila mojavensis]
MEIGPLTSADIKQLWNQVVTQTGVDKYNSDEWQGHYEQFWKCMVTTLEPYVVVQSVKQFLPGLEIDGEQSDDPIKPPPQTSTQVQPPVISDSISALRIPRVKPDNNSTGSVPFDHIPGGIPNELNSEPQPLPRQKPRFEDYMEQQPRNDQEEISQWHLQQQQEQLAWQDLNSRAGGIGPVKGRKRSRERYPHQQQIEQQYLQDDGQQHYNRQLELEKLHNAQLTEPIPGQNNQEQTLSEELKTKRKRSRRAHPDSQLSPKKLTLDNVEDYIQQQEGFKIFSSEADRKKDLLSKLKSEEFCISTFIRTGNEKIDSVSDQDVENILIEDIFQLADKKRITNDKSPTETIPESPYNSDEQIDNWLQSFHVEQAPPLELNAASITDFFKHLPKLPKLVEKTDGIKSVVGNVCLWDPMEANKDPPKPQAHKKTVKGDKQKPTNKSKQGA